jgi:hypothetical protein
MRTAGLGLLLACQITICAACDEAAKDPGPFDIDGWIALCEDRCDQLDECNYDQLVYDHGDLDNCKATCTYRLDYEADLAFLDETGEGCLEALYAQLGCIFHLSCVDLSQWNTASQGEDHPCSEKEAEAASACEGVDSSWFTFDCGLPAGSFDL